MKRQWAVRRTTAPRGGAARRWDRAYLHVLEWAARQSEEEDRKEATGRMRAAVYARVSTLRQARGQSIDQQVVRLKARTEREGWALEAERVYLDEGHSAARA